MLTIRQDIVQKKPGKIQIQEQNFNPYNNACNDNMKKASQSMKNIITSLQDKEIGRKPQYVNIPDTYLHPRVNAPLDSFEPLKLDYQTCLKVYSSDIRILLKV